MVLCKCKTGLRGNDLCPLCNGTPDSKERARLAGLLTEQKQRARAASVLWAEKNLTEEQASELLGRLYDG